LRRFEGRAAGRPDEITPDPGADAPADATTLSVLTAPEVEVLALKAGITFMDGR
jgi:hypothetical protein